MTTAILAVDQGTTVESAKRRIHDAWDKAQLFQHLYVVDGERRLLGSVSLKSLLIADPLRPVSELMEREAVRINDRADQELAARMAVPVVAASGRKGDVRHGRVQPLVVRQRSEPGLPDKVLRKLFRQFVAHGKRADFFRYFHILSI